MAQSYTDLKTEIAAFINRTDLTSMLDTFIDQAEAEMQIRAKELEFEQRSTVTVTAGVATLPTGFLSARSVIWNGDEARRDKLEMVNASNPSFANYYTIVGGEMRFADDGDGSVVATYNAKFTPLGDTNTSNAILAEFPSAYLYGSLVHAATYLKDQNAAMGYKALFEEQMGLLLRNNKDRKYAGAALQTRPA
jgi:hypothetical protein